MSQLPGFAMTEADLVAEAMQMPLERKIEIAVGLLRMWEPKALELSDNGYWLAYSGGKDSDCILELAKLAGVKYEAVYNVTTIDPPELVRYIKRCHPSVWFNRPTRGKHMLTRLVERGLPTRRGRWCCEEYKEQGGNGLVKIIGVRVAESARRAKLWRQVVPHRKHGTIVCPIVYWTDEDVWEFHRMQSLDYCELYDQGFHRLGCIGCPMAGPRGQDREFARWPRYEKMWKNAIFKFYARWKGVPRQDGGRRYVEDFADAEALWKWWRSGKGQGKITDCQGNFLFSEDLFDNDDDFGLQST